MKGVRRFLWVAIQRVVEASYYRLFMCVCAEAVEKLDCTWTCAAWGKNLGWGRAHCYPSHSRQTSHPKLPSGLQTKVKPFDTPPTSGALLTSSASTDGIMGAPDPR